MKALVILFGLVALAGAFFGYDYFGTIDVHQYDNDAKLKVLYTCLIGYGKCTPVENNLRARLRDAVETNCRGCASAESNIVVYVFNRIAQVNSSELYELLKENDETGKHSKDFLKFVQSASEERGYPKLSDEVINGLPDSS